MQTIHQKNIMIPCPLSRGAISCVRVWCWAHAREIYTLKQARTFLLVGNEILLNVVTLNSRRP